MDTGKSGDASPWRIKVTVEAEPRNGSASPRKKSKAGGAIKSIRIPLKSMESSSPLKKIKSFGATTHTQAEVEISEAEVKRPQRKRKGTPIRRKVQPRAPPERTTRDEQEGMIEHTLMHLPPSSPTARRKSGAQRAVGKMKSLQTLPKSRGPRLSEARESLDRALGDAITCGSDDFEYPGANDGDAVGKSDAPGDMTMLNEDFTMVSVETLQSMKGGGESSFLSNTNVGDKSALSVSYLPSSPPKPAGQHNSAVDEKGLTPAQVYEAMSWKLTAAKNSQRSIQDNEHPQAEGISSKLTAARRNENPLSVLQQDYEGDPMSWRFTGRPRNEASLRAEEELMDQRMSEWRRERKGVGQEIENADPSRVITIEEDLVDEPEQQSELGAEQEEEDIWQEEASRSLEENEPSQQQQKQHMRRHRTRQREQPCAHPQPAPASASTHELSELFSSTEPAKPPRGKIPRTWRRTSGMDFHYSDSPAHDPVSTDVSKNRQDDSANGGGSRASSGVLTPPESASEEDERTQDVGVVDQEEKRHAFDDGISLTHPDAAGTQLQDHGAEWTTGEREDGVTSSLYDSSSTPGTSDDDEDDTGLFWQSNLPHVYNGQQRRYERPGLPQRQRAIDLSELLGVHENNRASDPRDNPAGQESADSSAAKKTYSPLRMRAVEGKIKMTSSDGGMGKVVSSPLRKGLLRSSKVLGSSMVNREGRSVYSTQPGRLNERHEDIMTFDESFESKASDQRQLLSEMASARKPTTAWDMDRPAEAFISSGDVCEDNNQEQSEEIEETYDEESDGYDDDIEEDGSPYADPSRSYEERLNLDSPQKIMVNFNDSAGNSSLLAPKREYVPLFDKKSNIPRQDPQEQSSSIMLVSSRAAPSQPPLEPSLFSRLTNTFWSAVIRPSGPTFTQPTPKPPEPDFPVALRARIRRRYGVLRSTHPWTMQHMRTLHRMHNSCTSGKIDSIIPKTGPLPAYLRQLVATTQKSASGFEYTFTSQHAYVVFSLLQVLVSAEIIEAMERGEVEMLGDSASQSYKGTDFLGRNGGDLVEGIYKDLTPRRGQIDGLWVVKCLGDCVMANIGTATRLAREVAEKARLEKEGEVQEAEGDHEEDDYQEDEEEENDEEGGEMLPRD